MKREKLFVLFVLACCTCCSQTIDFEPVEKGVEIPPLIQRGVVEVSKSDFFLIQIVPSQISFNTTSKFVLVNHTNYELYWNTVITLEYFERSNWQPVTVKGDWIDIGYVLNPGEIFSSEIVTGDMNLFSLVTEFNNGKKGRYRLLVKITVPETGRYDVYAEFEII